MTEKLKSQLAAAKVMDEVSPLAPLSRQRRWQLEMERIGMCTQCGGEYARPKFKQCEKCARKAREAVSKRRVKLLDLDVLIDAQSK